MPIVSLDELQKAAQQQFRSEYQIVHERAQKPFVAQLVPLGAGPPLYIAQRRLILSVTKNPKELDCLQATKLTRLLLYIIHVRGLKEKKSPKMGVVISWITEELEAENRKSHFGSRLH